jgi:hypothetical protein
MQGKKMQRLIIWISLDTNEKLAQTVKYRSWLWAEIRSFILPDMNTHLATSWALTHVQLLSLSQFRLCRRKRRENLTS